MAGFSFGRRGDYVKDVQSILTSAGLYSGRIDGEFGPQTLDAVKTWQSTIGEKSDGVWGPMTAVGTARYLARFNDYNAIMNGAEVVIPSIGASNE